MKLKHMDEKWTARSGSVFVGGEDLSGFPPARSIACCNSGDDEVDQANAEKIAACHNGLWQTGNDASRYKRVLTFSPAYPKGDPMRMRVMDGCFVRISTDVTKWIPLDHLEP